jgi:hypothetical protein
MLLPARGSVQDRVLQETIQRERFESFQKTTFLGHILAKGLGVDSAIVDRLEEALELAIFQTAWDPREIEQQMAQMQARLRQEREARLADARLMAKVDSYTVYDDDEDAEDADLFESAVGRRQFKGTASPWSKDR